MARKGLIDEADWKVRAPLILRRTGKSALLYGNRGCAWSDGVLLLQLPGGLKEGGGVKIGIFGGSFDPVHHGHLIMARDALERFGLDHIRLIPAGLNPLKQGSQPAPSRHRIAMLREAVQGEPRLVVDDLELDRPPPSYMIDTLESIGRRFEGAQFHLLIGADNLEVFDKWKDHERIRQLARLVVFGRSGTNPDPGFPVERLERILDLSSTEIRARVASGQSIQYLVPASVTAYIAKHDLYRFEHQLP